MKTYIAKGYFEVDKGKFESSLIREKDGSELAYTHGDEVIVTIRGCASTSEADRKAIETFAEQYGLPVLY